MTTDAAVMPTATETVHAATGMHLPLSVATVLTCPVCGAMMGPSAMDRPGTWRCTYNGIWAASEGELHTRLVNDAGMTNDTAATLLRVIATLLSPLP